MLNVFIHQLFTHATSGSRASNCIILSFMKTNNSVRKRNNLLEK